MPDPLRSRRLRSRHLVACLLLLLVASLPGSAEPGRTGGPAGAEPEKVICPDTGREALENAAASATLLGGRVSHGSLHRYRAELERALDLLREEVGRSDTCHSYFRDLDVDLAAWLAEDRPPYIVHLPAEEFGGASVCGKAQSGEPFTYLFVNSDCALPGHRACNLASLVLHELGHLARRDVDDHEPPEFFAACSVGCLRPGRFR